MKARMLANFAMLVYLGFGTHAARLAVYAVVTLDMAWRFRRVRDPRTLRESMMAALETAPGDHAVTLTVNGDTTEAVTTHCGWWAAGRRAGVPDAVLTAICAADRDYWSVAWPTAKKRANPTPTAQAPCVALWGDADAVPSVEPVPTRDARERVVAAVLAARASGYGVFAAGYELSGDPERIVVRPVD